MIHVHVLEVVLLFFAMTYSFLSNEGETLHHLRQELRKLVKTPEKLGRSA